MTLLLTSSCGTGAPQETGKPNLLLISADTLRHDHVSAYGYERETTPCLDAFFREAEIYTRAYAPYTATTPSLVSLLTGKVPASHGVRLLNQKVPEELSLLPDLLADSGYQTAGIVSNSVLTVEATDLDRHFDYYDDFVAEREQNRDVYQRRAPATTDAALLWLTGERDPSRPHFLWVHYIDPHGPYDAPPDRPAEFSHEGSHPLAEGRIPPSQRVHATDDGLFYVDEYDAEIAYMDREIGRLLTAYESLGLLDRTIVVFTADHGETLLEHEHPFRHGHHVWEALARVPLMVRYPDGEALRHEAPVSLVDVVPTLANVMGLPLERTSIQGTPLGERSSQSPISIEVDARDLQHRALVRGNRKWFVTVSPTGEIRPNGWLDLSTEPEPSAGLLERRAGETEGFELLIEWASADPDVGGQPSQYRRGERLRGPKVAPARSQAQLEALRRLGYAD